MYSQYLNELNKYSPNENYNLFWYFLFERQNIFYKRYIGVEQPWTDDPILKRYKFTNVYRVNDRVTQYLISHVIDDKYDDYDMLFRILLFKLFNKIETWEALTSVLGDITYKNYSFDTYKKALDDIRNYGNKLYSAAYIMPSGISSFKYHTKHYNNLKLIEMIFNDDPIKKFMKMQTLKDLYQYLLSFPTLGQFLAFQYSIDINYSRLVNFSEMDYIVPGPGALRGIKKCFKVSKKSDYIRIIRLVTILQEYELKSRGYNFPYLGSRKMQLIDIQNVFCEFDKYTREYFNDEHHRIKQIYSNPKERIQYKYPEKWNL